MAIKTKAPAKPATKGKATKRRSTTGDQTTLRSMIVRLTAENADLQGKLTAAEGALQEYKVKLRPFLEELKKHRGNMITLWQLRGQQIYMGQFDLPVYEAIPDLDSEGSDL